MTEERLCVECHLPLWPQLARLGEDSHPACLPHDFAAQYCRRGCPDLPDCCLKAHTFRPIRDVPTGERL